MRSWQFTMASLVFVLAGCAVMTQIEGARKPGEAGPGEIEWRASFEEAAEAARSENKPMMLVFYGVSSKRLDERVFTDPKVIELAQNFVGLKVGAGQADLTDRYKVQEFPTTVFADPRGGEYDRFAGYKSGESFAQILESALIPLEAEYTLQIDPLEQKLARVKCVFRNVRRKSLIFSIRERHVEVLNVSYSSTDSRPGWEKIEENVWLMKFNTPASQTVTIEYAVGLSIMSNTSYEPEYISYVGDGYAILDGRALFLAPQDLHMIDKTEVHLGLPSGWRVLTPWEKRGTSSFSADSLEEVLDSVFCIGQFKFVKRQLGDHELYAIRCGTDEFALDLEQVADEIVKIFKHYVAKFGDFPHKRYLAIFADPARGRKPIIHGSAHSVGFAGPANVDDTFVAHEIFHVWNGGILDQKSDYEGWFKEGFTQYYGYLTPYRTRLYSKERFLWYLKRDYGGYVKRYGTDSDMALTRVKEELARREGYERPASVRLWIMYYKGALVASLMNAEIRDRTDNAKTLDDLMYYMFHEFRDRKYSSEDILEALNTVTGEDFTHFFSDFVYGRTKLPSTVTDYQESAVTRQ